MKSMLLIIQQLVVLKKYVYDCDMVAGILLGRTTIEGWFVGNQRIIYDVNNMGYIESNELNHHQLT